MKVGIFLSGEPTGGGKFQYCLAMLEALAEKNGSDLELIGAAESPLWEGLFSRYGVAHIYVPTAGWTDRWRRLMKILHVPFAVRRRLSRWFDPQARKMFRAGCDLWIFPSHDQASIELPLRSVVSVHDLMHRYEGRFPETSGDGQFEAREVFFRAVYRTAEKILVNSKVGLRQFEESYGPLGDRGEILPYIPYTHPEDPAAKPLALPEKYIFYPAQFWKHKNHENLIAALGVLKERHGLKVEAVFVGSRNNSYEDCMRLVDSLALRDQIHVLGYVEENQIPALYRQACALVMPTFMGPITIPQLEAFVYECPVAISNVYGIPDQVGDAALLFDPSSVEEIAEAIRKLWTDESLRNDLKRRGRTRAAAWDRPKFASRLIEILRAAV